MDVDEDVGAGTRAENVDVDAMGGVGAGTDVGDRAYNSVHLWAVRSCCTRFRIYSVAIEGTRGSCGLGSVRRDERESITLKSDNAGDQFCLRISMHIFPLSDIFMWYIRVTKVTFGAEKG